MIIGYDTEFAKEHGITAAILLGYVKEKIRLRSVPLKGAPYTRITQRECAAETGLSFSTCRFGLHKLIDKGILNMYKLPGDHGFWYSVKEK